MVNLKVAALLFLLGVTGAAGAGIEIRTSTVEHGVSGELALDFPLFSLPYELDHSDFYVFGRTSAMLTVHNRSDQTIRVYGYYDVLYEYELPYYYQPIPFAGSFWTIAVLSSPVVLEAGETKSFGMVSDLNYGGDNDLYDRQALRMLRGHGSMPMKLRYSFLGPVFQYESDDASVQDVELAVTSVDHHIELHSYYTYNHVPEPGTFSLVAAGAAAAFARCSRKRACSPKKSGCGPWRLLLSALVFAVAPRSFFHLRQ